MAPGLLREAIQAIQLIAVLQPQREEMHKHVLPSNCHRPSTGAFVSMHHESCQQNFRALKARLGTRMRTMCAANVPSAIVAETRPDQPFGWLRGLSDALAQHIAFGSGFP